MPRNYACPCCDGQGLVHAASIDDEPLECVECDSTGFVTREHRDVLLAWRHECRLRRPGGDPVSRKSPNADAAAGGKDQA